MMVMLIIAYFHICNSLDESFQGLLPNYCQVLVKTESRGNYTHMFCDATQAYGFHKKTTCEINV